MSIYTSEKVLPYVYMCIHKTTGQFYIGSRASSKLKIPSHLDFPKYRTSSKYVKPIFDEFNWFIVAEFFNALDAYDYEQKLIHENFNNTLILNEYYYIGVNRFTHVGFNHTDDTKLKMRNASLGKKKSTKHCLNMSISRKGISLPCSREKAKAISNAKLGKPLSESHKNALRTPKINKKPLPSKESINKTQSALKILRDRDIVEKIYNYKLKYKRKLILPRQIATRSYEYLEELLSVLINKYGIIE